MMHRTRGNPTTVNRVRQPAAKMYEIMIPVVKFSKLRYKDKDVMKKISHRGHREHREHREKIKKTLCPLCSLWPKKMWRYYE
jgi:hypothetical protein